MSEPEVWTLVLAGGSSRRMGQPKLLLPAPSGTVLRETLTKAVAAGNCRVAVAAPALQEPLLADPGAQLSADQAVHQDQGSQLSAGQAVQRADQGSQLPAAGLPAAISGLPVEWLRTTRSAEGIGATLADGLAQLIRLKQPEAVMVLLADQPEINSAIIRAVAERYRQTRAKIVQARYVEAPAHPVLFAAELFPELVRLAGDEGAKALLRKHRKEIAFVEVEESVPRDLDTPDDYAEYLKRSAVSSGARSAGVNAYKILEACLPCENLNATSRK